MKLNELTDEIYELEEKSRHLSDLLASATQLEAWAPTKRAKLEIARSAAALEGKELPEDPSIEKDTARAAEIRKVVEHAKIQLVPQRNKLGSEIVRRLKILQENSRAGYAQKVKDAVTKLGIVIEELHEVAGTKKTHEFLTSIAAQFLLNASTRQTPTITSPAFLADEDFKVSIGDALNENLIHYWVKGYSSDVGAGRMLGIISQYESEFGQQDQITEEAQKKQHKANKDLMSERVFASVGSEE